MEPPQLRRGRGEVCPSVLEHRPVEGWLHRPVVPALHVANGGHLLLGDPERLGHNDPVNAVSTGGCRVGPLVLEVIRHGQDQVVCHRAEREIKAFGCCNGLGHRLDDILHELGCLSGRGGEEDGHGKHTAVHRLVEQLHFHRELHSVDGVLARRVEVELLQLHAAAPPLHEHVQVRHLDVMAVERNGGRGRVAPFQLRRGLVPVEHVLVVGEGRHQSLKLDVDRGRCRTRLALGVKFGPGLGSIVAAVAPLGVARESTSNELVAGLVAAALGHLQPGSKDRPEAAAGHLLAGGRHLVASESALVDEVPELLLVLLPATAVLDQIHASGQRLRLQICHLDPRCHPFSLEHEPGLGTLSGPKVVASPHDETNHVLCHNPSLGGHLNA
mmetsp:Transcript_2349/g.5554  ORF Transcript_2349/g.5554 Transcript_2349/m.5554 type:complete len:385 (+) Transcript_2349:29-1183(+)